jgi:hypothetical protein
MPKILPDFPVPEGFQPQPTRQPADLRLPQLRVLQVLAEAKGPITRARIASRMGYQWPTSVNDAIGSSDPQYRARGVRIAGEKTVSIGTPLLDLGCVSEVEVDVDGIKELGVLITDVGRQALADGLKKYGGTLPALRNPGPRAKKSE